MANSARYQQLAEVDEEKQRLTYSEDSSRDGLAAAGSPQQRGGLWTKAACLWAAGSFCLMVSVGIVTLAPSQNLHHRDILNYSPARDAIKYHTVVYPDAVKHKTPFMGDPSPELDAAWEADYDMISRIPKSEALHLDPPSDELPNDPGYYPVMLDIFHSLHCLNDVRKTLNPDYYGIPSVRHNTTAERAKIHLDHCLEHIRMSLWCSADVSPIPFQNQNGSMEAQHDYSHTCRDREAILEWARINRVRHPF